MQFGGRRKVAIPCKLYLAELCRSFKMRTTKDYNDRYISDNLFVSLHDTSYKEFELLDVQFTEA